MMRGLLVFVSLVACAGLGHAQSVKTTTAKQTSTVKGKWKTTVVMPSVSGRSAVIQFANAQLKKDANSVLASFKQAAQESFKDLPKDMAGTLELYLEPTFTLLNPNWVCGYWTVYEFMGGAHGMTTFRSFNYGQVGGKPKNAGLGDLFANKVSAAGDLTQVLTQKLLANKDAAFIADGSSKIDAGKTPFAATKSGLTFLFEPYVCGPYSAGTFKVPVAWKEIQAPARLQPR
ncbi:MAG TPA: DUF4163 domain-containing protein [Fimbriimonadaceae bacterium]|nr:DUF4163 domain-containing protein [Fimbriimonadaceae bacterium]HRJ97077.1 DUF4163 domain-containing protein [Fimbriimonadaceae bacterium]